MEIAPVGNLYAGSEGGIYSTRDCNSWSPVNAGLTVNATKPPLVIFIDVSSIYAGFDGDVVWKKDDSSAWTAASSNLPLNSRVKAIVKSAANLYAAVYSSGVFKGSDSGGRWSACGSLADTKILSLLIDGYGTLYAGTESGVFASSDGCSTCHLVSSGLAN